MLTKLTLRNFKRFTNVEIELGNPVVFIGPNNSGKTTALQALALWHIGLQRWREKRGAKLVPENRPGVTINRRDLVAVPVPDANLLWRNLHVHDLQRVDGKQQTQNIRVDIIVDGVDVGVAWSCGMEFDYANEESMYCRPLRTPTGRMTIPSQAFAVRLAFLPPMAGLAANETRLDSGAIAVRIGEGRTAEVLRNLCYQVVSAPDGTSQWMHIQSQLKHLFGVRLNPPVYIPERGELTMSYQNPAGKELDLSTSGRGLQQMLLLLAHLAVNPQTVLLLDEPDAHLEILRQRHLYQILTETAQSQASQIIMASHSEVILNEAADRDMLVSFVGRPHRIDDRGMQTLKALKQIGFDHYYQAQQRGWILYLEGSTDLAMLRAFARLLKHAAQHHLERPFVHYVYNQPQLARDHFYGLREAKPDLVGIGVFDHLEKHLGENPDLILHMWQRRELENYLCLPETLRAWAYEQGAAAGPLFALERVQVMNEAIAAIEQAMQTLGKGSPWSTQTKVSDDFLNPLFAMFFQRLNLPNLMQKTAYHTLVPFVPVEQIDPDVPQMLDAIINLAVRAAPEHEDEFS